MRNQDSHLYKFGSFCLDSAERLLLRHGKPFTLPDKAFEILLVLVENSGHLVEKEALMQQVWPDASVEDGNLTVNMSHLRAALGDDQAKPRYIETIRGHGYRFIARVQRLTGDNVKQAMERQTQAGLKAKAETGALNRHAAVAPAVWSNNSSPALGLASTASRAKLEPVGGAVPLASEFYIERPTDEEFQPAIARQDSIVLVKGARQVGKTSLLARGLQQARALDARIVLTDFQNLNAAYLASVERLLLTLAESMVISSSWMSPQPGCGIHNSAQAATSSDTCGARCSPKSRPPSCGGWMRLTVSSLVISAVRFSGCFAPGITSER